MKLVNFWPKVGVVSASTLATSMKKEIRAQCIGAE